ncbi:MAG: SurA N-terminal domain-containing protein, partial [Betaproteobacteria bacterium]|nr:SurA N-terminal domain-containing protein [Betaproteobacteria bacterium]
MNALTHRLVRQRPLLAGLILSLMSCLAWGQFATPQPKVDKTLSTTVQNNGILALDNIIAVVNNEVITRNDLNDRIAFITKQLQKQGTNPPPLEVMQKQMLEQMINDLVQVQEAKETGIRVDDATLDKTLQRIAEENNLSMTAFRGAMEADGLQWRKFREDIRNEILRARLREREVESNVTVTEAEVDTQVALEAKEATTDQEFRLAHILIVVPEQATAAQIDERRKRALLALSEIRKGTEFAQVSAQYSDAPDGVQGGNLGWRPAGRLPQLFLDA